MKSTEQDGVAPACAEVVATPEIRWDEATIQHSERAARSNAERGGRTNATRDTITSLNVRHAQVRKAFTIDALRQSI